MKNSTLFAVAIVAMSVTAAGLILVIPSLFNNPSSNQLVIGGVLGFATFALALCTLVLKAQSAR